MKQLFAARRRKAQIEMKNMPLILNSSTVSDAGASTIGGDSVASSSYSGGEGTNSIDDTISLCGSVKTLGSSVMDSVEGSSSKDGNASCDFNSSTAKSVGSAKPPKSTYSSRRALDRYLGKKSSSSRGKNNKSGGGGSVGSSTSTKDTKSTLDGNDDDDEDISTLGSTSMDSMDNSHTALSSSSRGGAGAGSGTILSPVREETFFHNSGGGGVSSSDLLARSSSVSTVLIDNTSSATGGSVKDDIATSMIDEEEDGTKAVENETSITGQQHLGESMDDSSNNGILRDRAYSKEDTNANDEHNEEQPPEKSVRFHLSPLEKMQREKEREKAQCSPPRVGALTLENDDGNTKDSEEVSQQLEVCDDAENDSSHVFESTTTAAHDMVEEDVEFTKFMAALRKEVAGDHKEVSLMLVPNLITVSVCKYNVFLTPYTLPHTTTSAMVWISIYSGTITLRTSST